jgi:hypothetical protein
MAKTKRKRKGANLALQKLLRGPADTLALSSARQQYRPESYATLVQLLRSNEKLKKRFCPQPFPKTVAQLKDTTPLLERQSLEREILWAKAYLLQLTDQISRFLSLTENYEDLFLKSRFEECHSVLDSVEQQFGMSLWFLKHKLALLQTANGPDAQRTYAIRVQATARKAGFIQFLIYFLSLRNDSSISFDGFIRLYLEHIKKAQMQDDVVDYLNFHILHEVRLPDESLANILRIEFSGAVIDYYETIIKLARLAIANDRTELFKTLSSAIEPLLAKTSDPRLEPLLCGLDQSSWHRQTMDLQILKVSDLFLSGALETAVKIAREELEERADNADLLILIARAGFRTASEQKVGEPRVFEKIIGEIDADYGNGGATHDSFDLLRYAVNFGGQKVADALWGYTQKEYSYDPRESAGGILHYSLTGSRISNPLRIIELSPGPRQRYVDMLSNLSEGHLSITYANAFGNQESAAGLANSLSWEAKEFLQAYSALEQGKFREALEYSVRLIESANGYYRNSAIRIKGYCLLELGQTLELVRFISSSYLAGRPVHLFPVAQTVEILDKTTRWQLKNDISVPIFLDIAIKIFEFSLEHQRRYAYEDFLFSHNVERPSELRSIREQFDRTKLIHFLRFICVESVMDVSTVFSGSRDIAEERVSVCRFLTELDPENAALYQNEVKDIVRRLMIQQRVLEVQQSKIYVDTDSIKKKIDKSFRESFARYQILLATKTSFDMDRLLAERREKAERFDIQGLLNLPLPRDEMTELFTSMILQLRDQFVSSTEHGLDGYLSVRIRHGTLQGQLRSSLQAAHLLTQRDSITGGYQTQNDITAEVTESDPILGSQIGSCLARFTSDVDSLIYEIINEWIQVKKRPEEKGFFDFTLTTAHSSLLSTYVAVGTSIDEFLDKIFHFFLDLLNFHLTMVRNAFNNQVKIRFISLLTALQTDLEALRVTPEVSELIRNATNAKTELLRAIDRVIEWFHLSKSTDREPFFIEDAMSISLESVRTFTQGIEEQIDLRTDKVIVVEGRMLTGLVDILTIVFENIIRHSGLGGRPKAFINVEHDEQVVRISIENEIAENVATQERELQIRTIKHAIAENLYGQSINREGGTGFHKIWKILNHDFRIASLRVPAELDFGFTDKRSFLVTFAIPVREVTDGNSHR